MKYYIFVVSPICRAYIVGRDTTGKYILDDIPRKYVKQKARHIVKEIEKIIEENSGDARNPLGQTKVFMIPHKD